MQKRRRDGRRRALCVYENTFGLAFVIGVADVGACLLQVIHADKCILSGNSRQESQEWPAKVLGLASYGQDKLAESAQLSATAESNAVQWLSLRHI